MNQLDELRRTIPQITASQLGCLAQDALLLDVRESHEVQQGAIPNSMHVPLGAVPIELQSGELGKLQRDRPVYIYCASGVRSLLAAKSLRDAGFSKVWNVSDGYYGYVAAGGERYARQVVLPGIGTEGQAKLRAARVALVGAGGIGCPAALYLAGAGVGTLGIVDFDVVERSNLQRQVLFSDNDVGQPKVAVAAERVSALNPEVKVEAMLDRVTARNVGGLVSEYDYILDGSDNFETRYLVNDACVSAGKQYMHASVYQWQGLISVFGGVGGPCYRCLFPTPPPQDAIPNCAVGGVLGATVGVMGSLAAAEIVKLIVGAGESLKGVVLKVDALNMSWNRVALNARVGCGCRAGQVPRG